MSLTLALIVLLFALFLWAQVSHVRRCLATARRGRRYLEIISLLRRLFEHLPQHRGMANAYLQGDERFRDKLVETQRAIDREIEALDPQLSSGVETSLTWRWQQLKSDWLSLKSGLGSMAAEQSFQSHTHLVMAVIYLLDDAAVQSGLCQVASDVTRLRHIVVSELPVMVEFIGRARGIGTGVASQRKVSVADRVKLNFLARRVEQAVFRNSQALAALFVSQPALGSQQVTVEQSRQSTLNFIQILNDRLLKAERIELLPTEYYDAGTAAIGQNLALFDGLLPVIVDHAERRYAQLKSSVIHRCTGLLLLGVGLLVFFAA